MKSFYNPNELSLGAGVLVGFAIVVFYPAYLFCMAVYWPVLLARKTENYLFPKG